jgi:hypothetical protein
MSYVALEALEETLAGKLSSHSIAVADNGRESAL